MAIRKIKLEGKTVWELDVYSNGRGSTRLRRHFATRIDAEDFLRDFRNQLRSGVDRDFENVTFKEEAETWFRLSQPKFSAGHAKRARGIINELIPRIGNRRVMDVTTAYLIHIQSDLLKQGFKPATVNRKTEVIMAVLNFAVRNRRVPSNPAAGFQKLREVREEMKFWEPHEAQSFLEFANNTYPANSERRWIYVVYLLALNTAMRAGEIWGLGPQDLVEGGEILFVRRQFDRVKKAFGPTKGRTTRRVPCNSVVKQELVALRSPHATFFVTGNGTVVNHDNFSRIFERDIRNWGGRSIRFHDLRHTATTLMILNGVDIKTVKEICGHKDISTTMRYMHLVENSIREVSRTFAVLPSVTQPTLRLVTDL